MQENTTDHINQKTGNESFFELFRYYSKNSHLVGLSIYNWYELFYFSSAKNAIAQSSIIIRNLTSKNLQCQHLLMAKLGKGDKSCDCQYQQFANV